MTTLPTKPSEVLDGAADFYKKNDWYQGALAKVTHFEWKAGFDPVAKVEDTDEEFLGPEVLNEVIKQVRFGYCAVGAIGAVLTNEEYLKANAIAEISLWDTDSGQGWGDNSFDLPKGHDLLEETFAYLAAAIDPREGYSVKEWLEYGEAQDAVINFNDASDTTRKMLLGALRKAARRAREAGR